MMLPGVSSASRLRGKQHEEKETKVHQVRVRYPMIEGVGVSNRNFAQSG